MKLTHRIAAMAAAATLATAGAVAVDAANAPQAQAACYSNLTVFKAKNVSCKPQMRHWNAIKNSASRYGAWVAPTRWSQQKACWINVVSHGVTVKK